MIVLFSLVLWITTFHGCLGRVITFLPAQLGNTSAGRNWTWTSLCKSFLKLVLFAEQPWQKCNPWSYKKGQKSIQVFQVDGYVTKTASLFGFIIIFYHIRASGRIMWSHLILWERLCSIFSHSSISSIKGCFNYGLIEVLILLNK